MNMAKTFRDALLSRVKPGLSLKAIADGAGVSYEQVKKIGQRLDAKTNVDDAMKIAAFFGMTVNEFVDDHLAQDRAETAETYNRLSREERLLLQATGRGLADQAREGEQG